MHVAAPLLRDAPPNWISPNYPEPPAPATEAAANLSEQPKQMSTALIKAAKQFDVLVAALPISQGDEKPSSIGLLNYRLKNAIGQELQKQLEAAEKELNQVQELFSENIRKLFELEET
ncbi:mediator of RNA polymerase II transcription subunit 21 [Senna tora]|uniref:Mediator of RNA polymerase II transcription subunit 21 n=1 Tax=Senna tora TaxID=362788 RepID=A0A834T6I3_9FABA|nr:mediator of RNA polymerase II transcription subunit 21 [Senna tora]